MKKLIALMLIITAMSNCKAQQKLVTLGAADTLVFGRGLVTLEEQIQMSFVYTPGILYTSNNQGDSVGEISFRGDTMTAVRNLLVYLLQQKSENDAAQLVLERINLDQLQKVVFKGDQDFDWDLKNYKRVLAKNKRDFRKRFPIVLIEEAEK